MFVSYQHYGKHTTGFPCNFQDRSGQKQLVELRGHAWSLSWCSIFLPFFFKNRSNMIHMHTSSTQIHYQPKVWNTLLTWHIIGLLVFYSWKQPLYLYVLTKKCLSYTQNSSETLSLHTEPWNSPECPHIGNGWGPHLHQLGFGTMVDNTPNHDTSVSVAMSCVYIVIESGIRNQEFFIFDKQHVTINRT